MAYEIEYCCLSHIGKVRKANQDNFICAGKYLEAVNSGTQQPICGVRRLSDRAVFGVFDGMGGEERGEMASYFAAKGAAEFTEWTNDGSDLLKFCLQINRQICAFVEQEELSCSGTTAAMLKFEKKKIALCNIGDSKIFYLNKRKMVQISQDHVAPAPFGRKPPLSQNLGIPEEELLIEPYIARGSYHGKDIYLICSDGLTDMVGADEIERMIRENPTRQACEQLLSRALENGGRDNITILLLRVQKPSERIKRERKERKRCKHDDDDT